jgi:hypothetical protein
MKSPEFMQKLQKNYGTFPSTDRVADIKKALFEGGLQEEDYDALYYKILEMYPKFYPKPGELINAARSIGVYRDQEQREDDCYFVLFDYNGRRFARKLSNFNNPPPLPEGALNVHYCAPPEKTYYEEVEESPDKRKSSFTPVATLFDNIDTPQEVIEELF